MKYDFFYVTKVYNLEECAHIREVVNSFHDPSINDKPADNVIKTSKVQCIHWEFLQDVLAKMHNMVLSINNDYFGLDIHHTSLYEPLHYNVYNAEDKAEYAWHKDAAKNECFDLKLTALLNVSQMEYSGGHFELFLNGPVEVKEFADPGSLLVFPSWTQHRVTPVTQGQRITLTKFYKGPNLK